MSLMPENKPLPSPKVEVREIIPAIEPEEYCSCLVTSGEVAIGALAQFIRGTDYNCTYYSQVLGRDDTGQPFDLQQTAEYQQYHRVKQYTFRLQGAMSSNFDSQTNRLTFSGQGWMLPGIIPNAGDCFIGDIGDGRAGLFSIESLTPLTYRDGSVYEINFKMIDFMNPVIEENLDLKTVAEYIFDRSKLLNGIAPIVPEQEYAFEQEVIELFGQLVKRYLNDFYSHEYSTLLVGGQTTTSTYDYYATKAFLAVTNTRDDPRIARIQLFNLDDFNLNDVTSFWTMLIERDKEFKDQAFQKYRVISTQNFHGNPVTRSIRWTGVQATVIPLKRREHVDNATTRDPYGSSPLKMQNYAEPALASLGDDRWYVLGEDFYTDNLSDITPEIDGLVQVLINGGRVGFETLLRLHERIKSLPAVHRYYLQLVLMIMIKLETNRGCEC